MKNAVLFHGQCGRVHRTDEACDDSDAKPRRCAMCRRSRLFATAERLEHHLQTRHRLRDAFELRHVWLVPQGRGAPRRRPRARP